MATTTRSTLNSTFETGQVRLAALSALTGMLAIAISVLVTAEVPAAPEGEPAPSHSPAAMSAVSYDTTVPAASSINNMVSEEQPATF
jgi:hypothetical protein